MTWQHSVLCNNQNRFLLKCSKSTQSTHGCIHWFIGSNPHLRETRPGRHPNKKNTHWPQQLPSLASCGWNRIQPQPHPGHAPHFRPGPGKTQCSTKLSMKQAANLIGSIYYESHTDWASLTAGDRRVRDGCLGLGPGWDEPCRSRRRRPRIWHSLSQ